MNLLVYEYICATLDDRPEAEAPRAASLMAEGRAMLSAAAIDCAAISGADVRTLLSHRFPKNDRLDGLATRCAANEEETQFRRLAEWCDYALVIAPEFDRILETRCRWAVECGAKLLGPSPETVALCADKLALAKVWEQAGVPTPPTRPFDPSAFAPPVVVKPRDGAGAGSTFRFRDRQQLQNYRPHGEAIIQPFIVGGTPFSVSYLIGPSQNIALIPCRQDIQIDLSTGAMSYCGGATSHSPSPEMQLVLKRVESIANRAVAAVPGLRGFVGVDVIFDSDTAIEINPRLTTSYVGLRQIADCNLMELLIHIVDGDAARQPAWRAGNFRFDPTGDTFRIA